MNQRIRLDVQDGIATVSLNRPDKHNGMDLLMLRELIATQRALRKRRDLRAVILRGEGPSFCAGLDFKSVLSSPAKAFFAATQLWWPMRNHFQRWSMGWRELPVPVIAVVHGNCFGAGIQLALGADIRVAAPDTKVSVMEAKWGLVPDMGGVALLRELLPLDVVKELVFTGRVIDAATAHGLGLVTHLADDPQAKAKALLAEMLTRSPDALAAGKRLLQSAWLASEHGALSAERRWQWRVIGRANQRVAVERNTRNPDASWKERRIR
ncbi:MAG: crotonase/enoyl-CoA hydratase family protein [Aquabacterium sp.]|nr:MAG: crotonase/enoyl-CoA hydratase family protein [Aquabacterium sp.]